MQHAKNYILFCLTALLFAANLSAQNAQIANPTLSIQGVLKKTNGTVVDNGAYSLTFKLYTVEAGGTAIWAETQSSVNVEGGIYSASLGAVAALAVPFDVPYFLGVTVATGQEMQPRTSLTVAPYAIALLGTAPAYFGDVKTSYKPADHAGWVWLNGRAKTLLTAPQQARATALGIGANLPSDDNLSIAGVSPAKPLGMTGGASTVTIAQSNLPTVDFTGTAASAGSHSHSMSRRGNNSETAYDGSNGRCTESSAITSDRSVCGSFYTSDAGSHTHTVTVASGGSGTPVPVQTPYLALNFFIYLGL